MNIEDELVELIILNAHDIPENICREEIINLRLIEDLNYDSVDFVNLIVAIEERWMIELNDINLLSSKMNNIQELYELIKDIIDNRILEE
ncbi:MAG: hypothetical protein ACI4EW_05140 [Butyrivibrio sp.]